MRVIRKSLEAFEEAWRNCRRLWIEEEDDEKINTIPTKAKQQNSSENPLCLTLKMALRTNIAKPSDEVTFDEWELATPAERKQSRPISALHRR